VSLYPVINSFLVAFFTNKKATQIQHSTAKLTFIVSIFLCINLQAQQFPFVYYTPKDGLVNSRVRSIKQDSKGRMYFITFGGLSVYDGVIFKNYNQHDGLANELVNDVIEISPDSILVATNAELLNTLVRGKIGRYQTVDSFYPVINRFIRGMDGFLYAVADDGLYKLAENKFTKIPLVDDQGIDIGHNLDRITEWNHYFFIIPWSFFQKEKLIIYDNLKQTVTGSITDKRIITTSITPQGDLWLSTENGIEKLDGHALQKGKIELSPIPSNKKVGEWKGAFIYFDVNGNTWFYFQNEVLHLAPSGEEQFFSIAQGLKTSNLSDLFVDREGNTWLASDGNGVVKLPGTNVQILGDLVPGTRNVITVLYSQSDTTWVFNKTDNSFYQIHNNHLTVFSLRTKSFNVANMYIRGETLYFIADNKVYSIEHKNDPLSYSHPILRFPNETSLLEIGATEVDPNGVIIQYIRENDSTFFLVALENNRELMRYKLSFALDQITFDSEGTLWLPTRDHHLLTFSLHPESPAQYLQLQHDYAKDIEGIGPRSIAVDQTGNVWIGTRYNGIFVLQFENHLLKSKIQLTTLQGLTDNFHYYLYCDTDNNIWAGSQTGLDKISNKNGEYIIDNITKSKNIFQGIYKIINKEDDVIWALTSNGEIIKVSLVPAVNVPVTPSFFITSLAVNDSLFNENETVFTYDQNNFFFRVASPSFIDEKSIRYSYRLKGSGQNKWSEPSNNALFNFINLAPGSYELNVKADFPGALYPTQTLKYAFMIQPPYWRMWWFRLLIAIFILSFLAIAIRYYLAKKLEKQRLILEGKQAMEKERTRIATDMHDDLGAGLTRIKFLSETIGLKKQLRLPVEEEIQSIRTYAHEMIDKMGEIVWALNEKNDSLNDLIGYTRSYAVQYLSENGLKSIVNTPEDLPDMAVNGEFRRNIFLSVKEALHNIIKHAQANQVILHFEISKELVILIKDDGIGYDPQNIRPYSNGLLNMHKRMTEIGGKMEIMSEQGTSIKFSVPLSS
jgi:signal transduction histidine kinase/ligand-binding sensor domain-containing protein